MLLFFKHIFSSVYKWLFISRRKRKFHGYLRKPVTKMDTDLKLIVLRYLCHQLDKTIKNEFTPNLIRGISKYEKAAAIHTSLMKSKVANASDVIWAGKILDKYKLWLTGIKEKQSFVENRCVADNKVKFIDIVKSRRSVRFWSNTNVPRQIIFEIIRLGIMAPSSCNRQAWKFIVVENTNNIAQYLNSDNKSMIARAPYIIYIAIDERFYSEMYAPALDAAFVAQNILLAIECYGLKACVLYQGESVCQKRMRKILGLQSYHYIYLAIPFGLGAEKVDVPGRVSPEDVVRFLSMDTSNIITYM